MGVKRLFLHKPGDSTKLCETVRYKLTLRMIKILVGKAFSPSGNIYLLSDFHSAAALAKTNKPRVAEPMSISSPHFT